ncbi:MAG: hypothetical protein E6I74_10880 [Chloroflexi bacterium]|nr:MAG: hypothetical protein E6I74_10880 [Chloroflexota bacterium]
MGPSGRSTSAWLLLVTVTVVSAGCAIDRSRANLSPSSKPSGPVQAIIAVGQRPAVPVTGEGAVWVPNTGDGTVSRIDPRSNRVVATLRIGNQLAFYQRDCEAKGSVHSFMGTSVHVRDCDLPSALAVAAGALWVLKNDEQMVLRVDPRSQHAVARVPLDFVPFDMAATDNAVWITGYWVDRLVRVDPKTNQVVASFTLPDGASGIAASDQAVWVASTIAGQVSRIDPVTNRVVANVTLSCPAACYQGSLPLAVAATPDAIWVRTVGNGLLVRIDPQTNRVVSSIDVSYSLGRAGVDHLALLDGAVWVCGISLQRIDPQTNRVSGTLDVSATSAAPGFGSLWITDTSGRVERISPPR